MQPADLLYLLIPFTNSLANILLKVSLRRRITGQTAHFILMQLAGYSLFVIVLAMGYVFLLRHEANHFIIILALNYLAAMYSSRLLLKEPWSLRDAGCDAWIATGIVIFSLGKL